MKKFLKTQHKVIDLHNNIMSKKVQKKIYIQIVQNIYGNIFMNKVIWFGFIR